MTGTHRDQMARQFGDNVRRLRERKGISQSDVAREMAALGWDWHQSTCYKTEQAGRRTEAAEAHDLARILDVPLAHLFRPGPEADAIVRAGQASMSLHRNWANAATAVDGLLTARDEAAKIVRQGERSECESVREACAELAADLARMTVESVTGNSTGTRTEAAI